MQDLKTTFKGKYPFRLGTTSYIIPEDLVPNVTYLGPLVDDVELVLFESDEISNLPDKPVLGQLKTLKSEHQLSYTVHLPLDTQLGSRNEADRVKSVDKCRRVMDLCGVLDPFAYVVHFHGDCRGGIPSKEMALWQNALATSAADLSGHAASPDLLCVETLDYPFSLIWDIVADCGMSVCLDVGHLAFYGFDVKAHLDAYWEHCRVVHLHGNQNGADHKDIGCLPPEITKGLVSRLSDDSRRDRVLTLEIFGQEKLVKSLSVMETFL